MSNSQLYDRDFYAWAYEQAGLLRAGRLSEADIAHIAEEIESLGKTEKRELISRLKVLLVHLLKWQFQPAFRGTSWRLTIEEQRRELLYHMADNPSLKAAIDDAMLIAFPIALLAAARETGIETGSFPSLCPWTFEQMTDHAFLPSGV